MPNEPLSLPRHTTSTHTLKNVTINPLRRRSPNVVLLRVTRRSRTDRRQQRLLLLIRQMLRLIKEQVIDRVPATGPARASHKLNRPTIGQHDRFLPVGLANATLGKLVHLRVAPLIIEKRPHPKKVLPRRLNLMRRMQNLTTLHNHLVQLNGLNPTVLTILPRNRITHSPSSQPTRRVLCERIRNQGPLPLIQRQPERRRHHRTVITSRPRIPRRKPDTRRLTPNRHSQAFLRASRAAIAAAIGDTFPPTTGCAPSRSSISANVARN